MRHLQRNATTRTIEGQLIGLQNTKNVKNKINARQLTDYSVDKWTFAAQTLVRLIFSRYLIFSFCEDPFKEMSSSSDVLSYGLNNGECQ